LETNATDRENNACSATTASQDAPSNFIRKINPNLCTGRFIFHNYTLVQRCLSDNSFIVHSSAVNGLSDKERKLSACEINLAGPLVPEDKENKLFSRYGVVSEGLRSSLHRYDHEKSCTISWKQTLNTEYTGIVGAHPLSSNSSCSIMHN